MRRHTTMFCALLAASPAFAQAAAPDGFLTAALIEDDAPAAAAALQILADANPHIEQIGPASSGVPETSFGGSSLTAASSPPNLFMMAAGPLPSRQAASLIAAKGYTAAEAYVIQIGLSPGAAKTADGAAPQASAVESGGETASQSAAGCAKISGPEKDGGCALVLEGAPAEGPAPEAAETGQPGNMFEVNGAAFLYTAPANQAIELPQMLGIAANISSTFQTAGNHASIRQK
jgi:hypothetical protein